MAEREQQSQGKMSVSEAGHKGGQKVHDLVEKGKQAEGGQSTTEGRDIQAQGDEFSQGGPSRQARSDEDER